MKDIYLNAATKAMAKLDDIYDYAFSEGRPMDEAEEAEFARLEAVMDYAWARHTGRRK